MLNDMEVHKDWKAAEEHVNEAFNVPLSRFSNDIWKQNDYKLWASKLLLSYRNGNKSDLMYQAMMAFPI